MNIIVESSTVAAIIRTELAAFGIDNTTVLSTNGHLYDYQADYSHGLSLNELNPFLIKQIRHLDNNDIIIATDPDEQGELIASHIRFLTPNSAHRRMIINDLSRGGIENSISRFNQREFNFDETSASKAAIKKIINLKMRRDTFRSHYNSEAFITTTAIAVARQVTDGGVLERLNHVPIKINNSFYMCSIPSDGHELPKGFEQDLTVKKPTPCVTADLITLHSLNTLETNTIDLLQESFTQRRVSYPRTNVAKLPLSATSTLREYTSSGTFLMDMENMVDDPTCSHFALHNTARPSTYIERQIAAQNRTATGEPDSDANIRHLRYKDRDIIAHLVAEPRETRIERLPPANALKLHLLAMNNAVSTIDKHAKKYEPYFYSNQATINQQRITEISRRAEMHYEKIWEHGLDSFATELIETTELSQGTIDRAIVSNSKPQLKRVTDSIYDSMTI